MKLALINYFLVILISCVYLSDLYKYFHTVTALWVWYWSFLDQSMSLVPCKKSCG